MRTTLREDITYFLLEKLSCPMADGPRQLEVKDMGDRPINRTDILLHLKYLSQWGYVKMEMGTEAELVAVPNPHMATSVPLNQVSLTQQGRQFFKRLLANSPHLLETSPSI